MFGFMRKSVYEDEIERISNSYMQRVSDLHEEWQKENGTLIAERDEWKRQNTDLEVRLDTLFIAFQKADLDKETLQDAASRDLVSLQQRHTKVVEERDSLQDRCDVLQGQLQTATAIIERYASIPWVVLASKSMGLLAELYEARIKKGSVKFWDTRYLDLQAQYDKLAPVEAVEAKEEY